MREYAGESDGKKLARFHMFQQVIRSVLDFDERFSEPQGAIVSLCGPDASEAPMFGRIGGGLLVDVNPAGFARAQALGVETYHGTMVDALEMLRARGERVAFAHMDFMGHPNEHVESSFRALRRVLSIGGVVAFTFLRGREHPSLASEQVREARSSVDGLCRWLEQTTGKRIEREKRFVSHEMVRVIGYQDLISRWLGLSTLERWLTGRTMSLDGSLARRTSLDGDLRLSFRGYIRYRSVNSPMGVLICQLVPFEYESPPSMFPKGTLTIDDDDLRPLVVKMARADDDQLAPDVFDLAKTQIAAWKAVDTMKRRREAAA